jgi:hypothetical protein
MHNRSKSFFENLKGVDQLFYTCDGQHFKTEEGASANARNLKKKGKSDAVTPVTRAECENGNSGEQKKDEAVKIEISAEDKKALTLAKGKVTRAQKLFDTAVAAGEQGAIDGAKIILDGANAELQVLPGYVAEPNG